MRIASPFFTSLALVLGCNPTSEACRFDSDCRSGTLCVAGVCVSDAADGGVTGDAGVPSADAGSGSQDAGTGSQDAGQPTDFALNAITPQLQERDEYISLQGTLPSGQLVVGFTGASRREPVVREGSTYTVRVPDDARSGPVFVAQSRDGPAIVGAAYFHLAWTPVVLGEASVAMEQSNGGLWTAQLREPVSGAVAFGSDSQFCVAGGTSADISCQIVAAVGDALAPAQVLGALTGPRQHAAHVRARGDIFVIGGERSGTVLASIEQIHREEGTFDSVRTPGSALITGRSGAGAIIVGPYLYVLGGRSESGFESSVERAVLGASGLGPFQPAAFSLPEPRAHFAIANLGGTIVVAGGENTSGELDSVLHIDVDAGSNLVTATLATALPTPISKMAFFEAGDTLALFGGQSAGAPSDAVFHVSLTATKTRAPLLSPRLGASAALAGDHILIAGGETPAPSQRIERVGLMTSELGNSSELLRDTDSADDFEVRIALLGDQVFALGGTQTSNGDAVSRVRRARLVGETFTPWEASDGLPRARSLVAAFANYTSVYAAGGYTFSPLDARDQIYRASATGNFTEVGTLDTQAGAACAIVILDQVYLIGGGGDANTLNAIQVATISADSLGPFRRYDQSLNFRAESAGCFVHGNHVFVLGGADTDGQGFLQPIARVQIASILGDGELGPFGSFGTLQRGRQEPIGFGAGDEVFLAGGYYIDDHDILQIAEAEKTRVAAPLTSVSFTAAVLNLPTQIGASMFPSRAGYLITGGDPGRIISRVEP